MQQTAHLFTPSDDSLQARIQAYQRVLHDVQQFWQHGENLDADTLGEAADVEFARQVLTESLSKAQQSIRPDELQQALSEGWLSQDAVVAMTQAQRRADIESRRAVQSADQSEHQQRR